MAFLNCFTCGKEFNRAPSNRRRSKHDFCGRPCYITWFKSVPHKINPKSLQNLKNTFWTDPNVPLEKKEQAKAKTSKRNLERGYKGSMHWNWHGGVTKLSKVIRNSLAYKTWRKAVFERDNYTCQLCGQRGGVLQADHIKPFAYFPELRFELTNGRTLCLECHKQTDTYMGRAKVYTNV